MKKMTAILLMVALLLTMTACNRNGQKNSATETEDQNSVDLSGTMEELVGKVMEANPVEFMGGVIPVDLTDTTEDGLWALKSYTGLDSADSITDIAVYESMTGSQAFSLVMVRVGEGEEGKTVAQQMKDNINPRKWICVGADQVMAAGYSDIVMFIMVDSNLGKTAQSYVDAFKTLCGGKVDFTI